MNRRTFLIASGVSTAGLVAGSAAYRVGVVWWDQTPSKEYEMLSEREAKIAEAIVDAIFPGDHLGMPNGNSVDTVDTLDEYLSAIDERTANYIRLLLHAIDELSVVSRMKLRRFHRRPRPERVQILNAWDTSRIAARREAFRALKLIFSMGYCESPQVMSAAGIDYECGAFS